MCNFGSCVIREDGEGVYPIPLAPYRMSVFLVWRGRKRQSQKSIERVDLDDVVPESCRDGAGKEEGFKQHRKTEWRIFL